MYLANLVDESCDHIYFQPCAVYQTLSKKQYTVKTL